MVSARAEGATTTLFSQGVDGKAREYHRSLYICFVDLRKAYDSINRAALFSVLQYCYHLPSRLL